MYANLAVVVQHVLCRIAGDVNSVAKACAENSLCKSFVMEGSDTGYLKTGGQPVAREGFDTYCLGSADGPRQCPGEDARYRYRYLLLRFISQSIARN